jgi:hypothetical protein
MGTLAPHDAGPQSEPSRTVSVMSDMITVQEGLLLRCSATLSSRLAPSQSRWRQGADPATST